MTGAPILRAIRGPTEETRVADLFRLDGKTALVTGGSRGIGAMIARGLVDAGAVVHVASRTLEDCEAVAAELRERGEAYAHQADLSSPEGCQALADELGDVEALHILVNNAGAAWGEPIDDYSPKGFQKVIDLNVTGVFFLTQALLPRLRAAASADDPARVINIGSIDAIHVPLWETYAYSASKAAVHQLTRHLGKRLVGEHINVNAIAPGFFESKMTAFALRDDGKEQLEQVIPMGRIGRADDMAGTAVYLSSRAGSYVTGAVIVVDGGMATLK